VEVSFLPFRAMEVCITNMHKYEEKLNVFASVLFVEIDV
jgi:hypothetical protein